MVRYDKRTAQRGEQYIEDRRRAGGSRGKVAGGIVGGGTIGVVIAIIVALMGGNGGSGFDIGSAGFDTGAGPVSQRVDDRGAPVVDPQAETREYVAALMADIQDTWAEYFDRAGLTYTETKLVLFTDAVQTGCGNATAGVGPFYCPAPGDNKVYIDLGFYDELATRFQAPGDFAQAYVIAHEIGHHIQYLTGISDKVRQAQQQDPGNANEYSVRMELQADCLAGVWGYSANQRTTESGQPI
ncbi:MAG: neutral zinc metallopeptidase, partial [Acidimicrobiia bacterium]|nr:neutral zinc metallopeptidase [Acidimicrobiia bacterium]